VGKIVVLSEAGCCGNAFLTIGKGIVEDSSGLGKLGDERVGPIPGMGPNGLPGRSSKDDIYDFPIPSGSKRLISMYLHKMRVHAK
jgi:hypothetical protein